jgi:copper chaperone CopZ
MIIIVLACLSCADTDEAFLSHVYGWAYTKSDSTGINDLTIRIRDINAYDLSQLRERTIITETMDSLDGYFELDSVCYGTTSIQGIGYVIIFIDSVDNPNWPDTNWFPDIRGPVDTVIFYLED